MGQDPLISLAKERHKLAGEGFAVFLVMCGNADYENKIVMSQAEIGETLSMTRQAVSRAIRRLLASGAIELDRQYGNQKSYRLSPSYGWKGKGAGHIKALSGGRL